MIITKDILDEKVPKEMMPTRLDSAMNLYTNVTYDGKTGIIVYNTNPDTWNCLYSFYELNHKFTIDNYKFNNENITYRELIEEYQKVYEEFYEKEKGNIKKVRIQTLIDEYKRTFDLDYVNISDELLPIFELKYSKTKNVWTLYYFENYVADSVDNLDDLLNQKLYEQKILPLDSSIKEIDGVELTSNIPYLLSIKSNIEKLNNNLIERKINMLSRVLETSKFVVNNAKHVKINYNKANELIDELLKFDNVHYLTKVPYGVYDMSTRDIINFLLIYDSIDFSFWGNPKWTIDANGKDLDGGIALLHCIFNLFNGRDSLEVYQQLENMTLEEFKEILKGNIDIPLLEERYRIVTSIAKIVNTKMNGSFYDYIKKMNTDQQIFETVLNNFSSFEDTRSYEGQTIYFYKLAQLLTSDILHVIEIKEQRDVNYSNLLGCADYKIPQVMQRFGILEYDTELSSLLETKTEIEENSEYEIEIRASMIVVINYIWEQIDKSIDRIDINDFIWSKGQDKTKKYKPYHLTRTTSY